MVDTFCEGAEYFMVKYHSDSLDGDFGKIISERSLLNVDLSKHEIHRSIKNLDGTTLFVFDLLPHNSSQYYSNPIKVLQDNLDQARTVEKVYPNIFKWFYDGVSVKAMAIVPSGESKEVTTIGRYGGTKNFIRVIRQQLENVVNMNKGKSPNYHFLEFESEVEETVLSIGSINRKKDMYHVQIDLDDTYTDVLKNSLNCINKYSPLKFLEAKYWAREINPDILSETKHVSLNDVLSIEEGWTLYPAPIKNLMMVEEKGNYNRYLLIRFLLSVHNSRDAKFVYYSVLSDKEREHVESGNCSNQWGYIKNNRERYDCPTNKELSRFIDGSYTLSHPLEHIAEYLEERKKSHESS